jgi:CheY-like chemotaxis protein
VASADPHRLRQVIWNLLANAVKYTPCGGCADVRVDLAGTELRVIVSDTGIGIAPEMLPHVFERFWQADSSSTREHGGLGLGLAISHSIVEMHGGQLEASSRGVGQGATFVVRLPVAAASTAEPRKERRRSPVSGPDVAAATSRTLAGLRVMVVDDDSDALAMASEILGFAGADVLTASSGSQALEKLEALNSTGADVLVIDLAMPAMDGFTLIDRIQASQKPSIREVPAAALTAYARTEDRVRALRRGFRMHLTKPIHPTELVAAVAALAGRVPTADADDRPSPSGRRTRTRVRR